MKWLIRILVALLVILAALMWLFFAQMSSVVKVGIEAAGTEALKVPVKVDSLSLSPWSGRASLEGLEIGNPPSFTSPRALRIARTDLVLDMERTQEQLIFIKELTLTDAEVNFEVGLNGPNLRQIVENTRNVAQAVTAPGTPAGQQNENAPRPKVKFLVGLVRIPSAKVTATAGLLPGVSANFTLPDITITDLGAESGGVTPSGLTGTLLIRLADEAAKSGLITGGLKNLRQSPPPALEPAPPKGDPK